MDSATHEMLETIRKRIASLQQMEQLIIAEFADSANGMGRPPIARRERTRRRRAPSPAATSGISRKLQIRDWLKTNGPAYRSEIIEGTGFPSGTVGSYLSQCPDLFENRDGKWVAK